MQPLSLTLSIPWCILIFAVITAQDEVTFSKRTTRVIHYLVAACCLLGAWRFYISIHNYPRVDDGAGILAILACFLMSFIVLGSELLVIVTPGLAESFRQVFDINGK